MAQIVHFPKHTALKSNTEEEKDKIVGYLMNLLIIEFHIEIYKLLKCIYCSHRRLGIVL